MMIYFQFIRIFKGLSLNHYVMQDRNKYFLLFKQLNFLN